MTELLHLDSMRSSSDIGYFEADLQTKLILDINSQAMEIGGWSDYNDVIGKKINDLFQSNECDVDFEKLKSDNSSITKVINARIGSKSRKILVVIHAEENIIKGILVNLVEADIIELSSKLDSVMNMSRHLIFIKDKDLKYTLVNKTTDTLFNMPCDKLIGLSDTDFLPPAMANRFREADLNAIKDGHFEIVDTTDGKTTRIIKRRILTPEGDLAGVVTVVIDVDQNNIGINSMATSILSSPQIGVICMSHKGVVEDCNKTAAKMIGADSIIDAIGFDKCTDVLVDSSQYKIILNELAKNGQINNFEIALRDKVTNIVRMWVRASIRKVPTGYLAICLDITGDVAEREEYLNIIEIRTNEIAKANDILFEVNKMGYSLLHEKPNNTQIDRLLEHFGNLTSSKNAFLFKRHSCGEDLGCYYMLEREWIQNNEASSLSKDSSSFCMNCRKAEKKKDCIDISSWCIEFEKGNPVYGYTPHLNIPDISATKFFKIAGSYCLVPIMMEIDSDKCWGFVGFSIPGSFKEWGPTEIRAIQALATLIGFTLARINTAEEYDRQINIFSDEIKSLNELQNRNIKELRGLSESFKQDKDKL